MLQDFRPHVRLKLSALWTSVMLCYIYCDYFELVQPGKLTAMLAGKLGPAPATPGTLLAASVLMAVPSVMIFLSLVLTPNVARAANVGFGVIYTLIMLLILVVPGTWLYYRFFALVEIALTVTVVVQAWRWPRATV